MGDDELPPTDRDYADTAPFTFVDFGSGRPFFARDRVTHLVYEVSRRGPWSAFRLAGPRATAEARAR